MRTISTTIPHYLLKTRDLETHHCHGCDMLPPCILHSLRLGEKVCKMLLNNVDCTVCMLPIKTLTYVETRWILRFRRL